MGQSNSLSSSLIVNMKDNTGAASASIKRNLRSVEDAERRFARNRAMVYSKENATMIARERAILAQRTALQQEARRELLASSAVAGRYATMGVLAAGYVAGKAVNDFAELERRVNRIMINAGEGLDKVKPTIEQLQKISQDTRQGFDQTVVGMETLVASGRSLEDAMAFLPSVAITAQASGAAIEDIALSADSLAGSMKVAGKDMQAAFDVLVEGGKQGKFELKDMASSLPSILSQAAANGYEGVEGLKRIVAMMQVLRSKTGNASDAATQMSNVLQKVWSAETAAKFKKFNINLDKELKKRTAQGQDLVSAFADVTAEATKGDMSKLPQLFGDKEVLLGMTTLVKERQAIEKLIGVLNNSGGSTLKDFKQSISDTEGALESLGNRWSTVWTKIGENIANGVRPSLNGLNQWLNDNDAYGEGLRKSTGGNQAFAEEQEREFAKQYLKEFPDKGPEGYKPILHRELMKVGRGVRKSVFDFFRDLKPGNYRDGGFHLGQGAQVPTLADRPGGKFLLDKKGNLPDIPLDRVPVPGSRERPLTKAEQRRQTTAEGYRFGNGRNTTDASLAQIAAKQRMLDLFYSGAQFNVDPRFLRGDRKAYPAFEGGRHRAGLGLGPDGVTGPRAGLWRDPSTIDPLSTDLGGITSAAGHLADVIRVAAQAAMRDLALSGSLAAATEAGNRRQSFDKETGPRWGMDPQSNALKNITGQVSITGTPTVVVANPPQPNVFHVNIEVNEAQNGQQIAAQFDSAVRAKLSGVHADTNYQAHA